MLLSQKAPATVLVPHHDQGHAESRAAVHMPGSLGAVVSDNQQLVEILRLPGEPEIACGDHELTGSRVDRQTASRVESPVPLSFQDQPRQAVVVDGPSLGIERRRRGSGGRNRQREPGSRNRGVVVVNARRMLGLLQGECLSVSRLSLCQAGRDRLCRGTKRQRRGGQWQRGPLGQGLLTKCLGSQGGQQEANQFRCCDMAYHTRSTLRAFVSCACDPDRNEESLSLRRSPQATPRGSVKHDTPPRESTSLSQHAPACIFPADV